MSNNLSKFGVETLTGGAQDVMWALFCFGVQYDGGVPSKVGRDQLERLGLLDRHDGWNWLTSAGHIAAIDAGYGRRKENFIAGKRP